MTSRAFAEIAGRWFIRRIPLCGVAAMAAGLFSFTVDAQVAGRQLLHGHVPAAIARFQLQPVNHLPATNWLNLAIGLPLRNEAALDKLLSEIYDTASTNYHRYLTPEQFAARFGPTEQDYQSLANFARSNGLTVTATYPSRTLLDVSGNAATVEKVFHVKMNVYRHPTENRLFFAPDAEPSVDLNVPILRISGLDDFSLPHPAGLKKNSLNNSPAGVAAASGSGSGGTFMGNDFRAAYAPGVMLNGAGQAVALLELDGYNTSDIVSYESLAGLPNATLTNILIDGYSGAAGSYNGEVALDIDMAISMATNLSEVIVYEAPLTTTGIEHILQLMASNNVAKQISSSWIFSDDPVNDISYKQMAAQGQTFFQASGDDGAYYSGIPQSADDTNVTLVGGTTLSTSGAGGAWSSETVWNEYGTGTGTLGSGGGTNLNGVLIPSWQSGISMTANLGSATLRNVPDVALTADNIFLVADGGIHYTVYGTSAAAPLWAGFCALVNQQATNTLKPPVGFLNPAIYAIGKGVNYAADFHDITTGNNTNANVGSKYFAVSGYDLCTGWGTPTGQNLINTLVPPDSLVISPVTGFAATGPAGGLFSPSSQIFFLTNSGASALTWSLVNTSAWLNASNTGGTLAAGGTNSVTISLTTTANSLAIGTYAAIVKLTNWNTHVVQGLPFTLQALQPLAVTPAVGFTATGPVAGPFSPNSSSFQLTNTGSSPLTWSLVNTSAWLTVSSGGTLAANAATTATVSLSSTATNLVTGIYAANVWFTNQTGGGALGRQFTLLVNEPLVLNGGFETGDFTDWTLIGDSSPDNFVANSSSRTGIAPHSGSYFAALGNSGSLGYLSQTLPTAANQSYLLSLWLDDANGLTPNEFNVSWNGNTITDLVNMSQFGWTNLQFVVTATSNSTVLQFGERDDSSYLGLDDVSLTPIPAAAFKPATVVKTNNNLKFAWSALTGLVYQVQFQTNLLQTNWTVLKSITATNTPVTFVDTNPITAFPQKFYRLLLLP
jgi:subtilase family serine protease